MSTTDLPSELPSSPASAGSTQRDAEEARGDREAMERLVTLLRVHPTNAPDHATPSDEFFVAGRAGEVWGRVFGGQVLGQSLAAAIETVDAERPVHSLHAYFLRPGDPQVPIVLGVENLRDGRSFSARRVQALQHGKAILSMIASFQVPTDGLDHQSDMPDVPDPESIPSLLDRYEHLDRENYREAMRQRPVDIRHVAGPIYFEAGAEKVAHQAVWIRTLGALPDDDNLHRVALAYISDFNMLEPVFRRHGITWTTPGLRPASLDHAMWWHRPARADEWLLFVQESPSAGGSRGLGLGRIYRRDGALAATVAQEGMIRVPLP